MGGLKTEHWLIICVVAAAVLVTLLCSPRKSEGRITDSQAGPARPEWVQKQIGDIYAWGDILFKEDSCPRTWVVWHWSSDILSLHVQYDKMCCPSDGCFYSVGLPSLADEFFYGNVLFDPTDLMGYLLSELPIVAVVIHEWSPSTLL